MKMTLQEFANQNHHPIVCWNNVFGQGARLAAWHNFEFPFDFDDLEGEINADDVWEWNGEGDFTDWSGNTIVRVTAVTQ